MKTSPLQLDESYVVEIFVKESGTEASADLKPSDLRIRAEPIYTQSGENPLKWEVDLTVIFCGSTEKPAPYNGKVVCRGFFTISDTLKEETQKHIVAVNCPAMLYSTTREIIANLTGRGRFGKMLLPSITFIDERKRFEPEPEAEAEPEEKPAKRATVKPQAEVVSD